jgi:hypothetical protein
MKPAEKPGMEDGVEMKSQGDSQVSGKAGGFFKFLLAGPSGVLPR